LNKKKEGDPAFKSHFFIAPLCIGGDEDDCGIEGVYMPGSFTPLSVDFIY
jgi:hypothetical protein